MFRGGRSGERGRVRGRSVFVFVFEGGLSVFVSRVWLTRYEHPPLTPPSNTNSKPTDTDSLTLAAA